MTADNFTIEFSFDELNILHSALNETCNGVPIQSKEFEHQVGFSEEKVEFLFQKIKGFHGSVLTLSGEELWIIISALNVTFYYVGDWECPIRVGCTPEELLELLKKIRLIYGLQGPNRQL